MDLIGWILGLFWADHRPWPLTTSLSPGPSAPYHPRRAGRSLSGSIAVCDEYPTAAITFGYFRRRRDRRDKCW